MLRGLMGLAAHGRILCAGARVWGVDQGGCAISSAQGLVDQGGAAGYHVQGELWTTGAAQGAPARNVVCAGCAISSGRGAEQGLLDKGGRAILLGISSARGWCGLVYNGGWWTGAISCWWTRGEGGGQAGVRDIGCVVGWWTKGGGGWWTRTVLGAASQTLTLGFGRLGWVFFLLVLKGAMGT